MTGPFPGIYKKNGKWYHRNDGGNASAMFWMFWKEDE